MVLDPHLAFFLLNPPKDIPYTLFVNSLSQGRWEDGKGGGSGERWAHMDEISITATDKCDK